MYIVFCCLNGCQHQLTFRDIRINDIGYFYYTFVTCECLKYGKSGSLFKTLNRRTDAIQDFF